VRKHIGGVTFFGGYFWRGDVGVRGCEGWTVGMMGLLLEVEGELEGCWWTS
jgi:hypothetical protein